jgi:DNA (cytosine-5)-methyltransferase 1
VLKWLSELYVSRVIIENVPEFLSWGPLDDKGRPIPSRKGKTFRAFIAVLRSLGYSVDWRILNAADYGDPTTRRRLFIQAVKGRKKIIWPQITHMNGGENLMGCKPWRPARDIIDWSIHGQSIFDRKRPLAAATMRRIAGGIEKYWGNYAEPFLAVLYGTAATSSRNDARPLVRPFPAVTDSGAHHALVEPFLIDNHTAGTPERIDESLRTVTTKGWFGMIEPFITRYNGGENRNHDVASPLPTLDTSNRYGLVEPLLVEYYGQGKTSPVSLPVKTITTKDRFALLEPFLLRISQTSVGDRTRSINEPLSTVMTKNEHCLVSPEQLDIRFRMLRPHELARAQGFPDDYRILGNRAEQTKQIGNAVPVNTAKALAKAVMEL